MFIASFASGPWEANCYLVGRQDEAECVVIDPGVGAFDVVENALQSNGWTLVGVIATHGHIDHIAAAAELANAHDVPMWMHSADDYMLTNPAAGLGLGSEPLVVQVLGSTALPAPRQRETLDDVEVLAVAGLDFAVQHAPGHSPGSCILTLEDPEGPVVFVGDVVFAGSIGRTDLPRGNAETMSTTLSKVILPIDDRARLLPGHGPMTTMAKERLTNPFLQPSFLGTR